jgi:sugar phosphate isomerase/epimerase
MTVTRDIPGAGDAMRTLTLGYLTCFGRSQVEVVEAAAAAGFTSVGLRVDARRAGDTFAHAILRDAPRLRDVRQCLADRGVVLSNVIGRSLEADTTDDDLRRLVDAAAALGSRQLLVNGLDSDEARMVGNLATLAAHARSAGMHVGVEFVPFHEIRSLPQALRMIAAAGEDNVGVVVDPLHLSRSGGRPEDVARIPAGRIAWGQLCDAPAAVPPTAELRLQESRGGRLLPGEGALPLHAFLDALPAGCEIEVESSGAGDDARTAHELVAQIRAAVDRFLAAHPARTATS